MTQPVGLSARTLNNRTELRRIRRSAALSDTTRAGLGQYFTPVAAARFIASLPTLPATGDLRVLDAGAGVGSLTAALVARAATEQPHLKLHLTTFEVNSVVNGDLRQTLDECEQTHAVVADQYEEDFIVWAVAQIESGRPAQFDLIPMNPPYRKIASDSPERLALQRVGIETTNLYTAFVALALRLLAPSGQLVAITPRSFANGSYFRGFRQDLLHRTAIRHLHVFECRNTVFADSDVLQENVIYLLEEGSTAETVVVSSSRGYDDEPVRHTVPFEHVVSPSDREQFIHIATTPQDLLLAAQMAALPATLPDLDVTVSTGRVVDFRTRENLRATPGVDDAPMLYPNHLSAGRIRWPISAGRKPNGLARNAVTESLLLPTGTYALVKRFTAKEEPRRVAASLLTAADLPGPVVAVENHLNVFHRDKAGLPVALAAGLTAYLNSSFIDRYVRLFSGHTQINAGDLRSLRYPSLEQLVALGEAVGERVAVGSVDLAVQTAVPALAEQ